MSKIVNATARLILVAIHQGNSARSDIIAKTKQPAGTVTAQLRTLKADGLIEQGDEGYTLTADATPYIGTGRMPRTESKMDNARDIVMRHLGKGRQFVLAKLEELPLSAKAAATYFQTLKSDPAVLAHQASLVKAEAPKLRKSKVAA